MAHLFIKKVLNKQNIFEIKKTKNKILDYKYLSPFVGVVYCWIYFFKNKNIIYLNYLPFWNFLIFLLLPPNCHLGPITGGAKYSKSSNDFMLRKFLIPVFYVITNLILLFRYKKLTFSTDLLRKNIIKINIKKCQFNFVFNGIKKNKKIIKKINFLFYYRKHKNKNNQNLINLIKYLVKNEYDVTIVGDKINIKRVKNLGYIGYNKIIKYLSYSKYSMVSSENIFSLFTIDAINNNVLLLIDKQEYKYTYQFKKNFIEFDFNNINLKKLKYLKK